MHTPSPKETLIIIASASKLIYIPLAYLGNVIEPSGMFSDTLNIIPVLFSVGASTMFLIKSWLLFYPDITVIVGIMSVDIIAPSNASPTCLFSIVIFLKSLDNEAFAKEIFSYIGVK